MALTLSGWVRKGQRCGLPQPPAAPRRHPLSAGGAPRPWQRRQCSEGGQSRPLINPELSPLPPLCPPAQADLSPTLTTLLVYALWTTVMTVFSVACHLPSLHCSLFWLMCPLISHNVDANRLCECFVVCDRTNNLFLSPSSLTEVIFDSGSYNRSFFVRDQSQIPPFSLPWYFVWLLLIYLSVDITLEFEIKFLSFRTHTRILIFP